MSEPKKETVRITLPPRPMVTPGGAPPIKKETVRINLPTRPTLRSTQTIDAMKRDTEQAASAPAPSPMAKPPVLTPKPFTPPAPPAGLKPPSAPKLPGAPGAVPAAPPMARPPVAPAPRPPTPVVVAKAPGAPPPAAPRPPAAMPIPVAPRPPAGNEITAPSAPSAPMPPVAGAPRPPIVTGKTPTPMPTGVPVPRPTAAGGLVPTPGLKPALKKETARIDLPPGPKSIPTPTIKMAQTQPLAPKPAPQIQPATLVPVLAKSTGSFGAGETVEEESGGALPLWACAAVFVLSLATFAVQLYAAFSAGVD